MAEVEVVGLQGVSEQTQRGVWELASHLILIDTASPGLHQCPPHRHGYAVLACLLQRGHRAEEPPGQMLRCCHHPLSQSRYCFGVCSQLRPEALAVRGHQEISP